MAFDEPRAGAAADLLVRLEALAHG
jgi:hypothetical protein